MQISEWVSEEFRPFKGVEPCKNERHNLFWVIWYVGPKDSLETVHVYGIFEVRDCMRCSRSQKRFHVPENEADVLALEQRLEQHNAEVARGIAKFED